MKQTDFIQKDNLQDLSVLSFSSAPNQSFQIDQQPANIDEKNQSFCFIVIFVILGFYFLIFSIIQFATNLSEVFYRVELDRLGSQYISAPIFISFAESSTISVYLSIQHITQLDILTKFEVGEHRQCFNQYTNMQMNKHVSILNTSLNSTKTAFPCGRYTSYYPQGDFQIIQLGSNTSVDISTDNIAINVEETFNTNDLSQQWADLQNPRFRNWVNMDAQQKLYKLWGKVSDYMSGNYQIKLKLNNQMPEIEKIIIQLHNVSALSGYNLPLCYLNFFYTGMMFAAALSSFLIQRKYGYKKLIQKNQFPIKQPNQIKIPLNSTANTPIVKRFQ